MIMLPHRKTFNSHLTARGIIEFVLFGICTYYYYSAVVPLLLSLAFLHKPVKLTHQYNVFETVFGVWRGRTAIINIRLVDDAVTSSDRSGTQWQIRRSAAALAVHNDKRTRSRSTSVEPVV